MSEEPRGNDAQELPHEEEALGRAYDGRLLLRLWPYIQPYRGQVAATILIFFPIFLLELAPAWVVAVGLQQILATRGLGDALEEPGPTQEAASASIRLSEFFEPILLWMNNPPIGIPNASGTGFRLRLSIVRCRLCLTVSRRLIWIWMMLSFDEITSSAVYP